jgi:hypothetical protein
MHGDRLQDFFINYGQAGDIPVIGDWDNTGKQRIGVFRQSQWWLDMNGDHVWTAPKDKMFFYGAPGDLPALSAWQ